MADNNCLYLLACIINLVPVRYKYCSSDKIFNDCNAALLGDGLNYCIVIPLDYDDLTVKLEKIKKFQNVPPFLAGNYPKLMLQITVDDYCLWFHHCKNFVESINDVP